MRFLTTLLPLITLAVRVAATNPEHDSIPLGDLPPAYPGGVSHRAHPEHDSISLPAYPGSVHSEHQEHADPLPDYDAATGSNHSTPLHSFVAHNAQNSVPGVPPSCSQAVQARVSAEIPRLFPNPEDRSSVRVVINPPNNNRNRPSDTCGCVTLCVITVGLLIYLYFLPDQQACPDSPVASGCIPSRRRNLHDSSAQCERWDIKACASGTSLTAKHSAQSGAPEVAAGGHRNRNAARISYRRRLELV
ncbi:hypothetical protein F5879DRAFT_986648 [Lentinula edodes]|nr:hypothetical protein F5879DRAFT_986648 [Lentinula edodes]